MPVRARTVGIVDATTIVPGMPPGRVTRSRSPRINEPAIAKATFPRPVGRQPPPPDPLLPRGLRPLPLPSALQAPIAVDPVAPPVPPGTPLPYLGQELRVERRLLEDRHVVFVLSFDTVVGRQTILVGYVGWFLNNEVLIQIDTPAVPGRTGFVHAGVDHE